MDRNDEIKLAIDQLISTAFFFGRMTWADHLKVAAEELDNRTDKPKRDLFRLLGLEQQDPTLRSHSTVLD